MPSPEQFVLINKKKRIIYSAIDAKGKEQTGFVEAESMQKALEELEGRGLKEITLHDDPSLGFSRSDLDEFSEKELQQMARFELKSRSNPNVWSFLSEVISSNFWLILIGLVLAMWGGFNNSIWLLISGVALMLSMPAMSLWNYRAVNDYNRLLIACAHADYGVAQQMINKLRPVFQEPEMQLELDIREACIVARNESLEAGLKVVEKWKDTFTQTSPGMYEARRASVYYAVGEYDEFIKLQAQAHELNPESETFTMDLALAHGRNGDKSVIPELLALLDTSYMPQIFKDFYQWIEGLACMDVDPEKASRHLGNALTGMMDMQDNPASWVGIAECSGYYALALCKLGETEKARKTLTSVWKILSVNGNKVLLSELETFFPEGI